MDPPQHNYHTRIRQNVPIKPSSLRQNSPDPVPTPVPTTQYPEFPPPGIVLHPDDASNKVFLAVARAFVSVENRAMTIKDIADRASRYGLVCQNLSAAAQAVTTYLRAHKARCDKQQDHPLLLSHVLSGTPADDDLLPALFSRSGGDSHHLQHRLTNFRKGTAPKRENKWEQQLQICGQKRKRPLRGCVARGPGSDNEPPPKVKLTLRLKPLTRPIASTSTRPIMSESEDADSDDDDDNDDNMSVVSSDDQSHTAKKEEEKPWSLPPYPRRSISIPCYTPSVDAFYPCYPPSPSRYKDPFRRSPSLATPPPDSEDEADDFHVAMARIKHQQDDNGWDADLDSEGEGDTVWESPGPRSPSAPLVHPSEVAVKEEPRDVQGMLDAWEDFDTSIAVAEVLARALEADSRHKVKQEEELNEPWDWQGTSEWASEDNTRIKQEDFGVDSLFPPSLSSPFSDASPPVTEKRQQPDARTIRPRAKTVPAPSPFFPNPLPPRQSVSSASSREPAMPSTALVTLLQSMSVNTNTPSTSSFALPPPTPCVSPLQTRCQPSSTLPAVVKVLPLNCSSRAQTHTFLLIDISVYQMMLGAFQLLRRIDTDFVNLSPIAAYSAAPLQASIIPNATVVTKGSPEVCGTWVPLATAQAYVREHISGKAAQGLEVFLSETLVERFPPALQDFHRSAVVRGLNQFGRHFNSTLQAADWEVQTEGGASPAPYHQHAVSALASSFMMGLGERHAEKVVDAPLSATEQELFHELCVIPDWDKENVAEPEDAMVVDAPQPVEPLPPTPTTAVPPVKLSIVPPAPTISPLESPLTSPESPSFPTISIPPTSTTTDSRPLRRSKRVASVLAAQHPAPSRARSRKSGSRNSLS
ncbi:hypothetical protein M413DRAFT_15187 [Hebeloma cylindrosporum]|uniref:GDS1 winged helix domain-containing protein n=1 Tax=Hebeloma cylindrosporum TaxID=76867 RepID=A0A0C3CYL7_HEBCY|nr:hypothetical protein M413DRAFT_15187 [Hebeloma cylindrosporum h7]